MEKQEMQFEGVRPSRLALLEGTFGLIAGLVVAILAWMSSTMGFDLNTNTVLLGLMLGLSPGLVTTIAVALLYGVVGLIVGYAHGQVYNLALRWGSSEVVNEAADEEPATPEPAPRRAEPTFGETVDHRRTR